MRDGFWGSIKVPWHKDKDEPEDCWNCGGTGRACNKMSGRSFKEEKCGHCLGTGKERK